MATTMSQEAVETPRSAPESDSGPASTPGLPPGADDILKYAPPLFKRGYREAILGRLSPKQAIRVHCRECMGWTLEECDNQSCPLWQVSIWGNRRKQGRGGKVST